MQPLLALDASAVSTRVLVKQVRSDQWEEPTPCPEWDVRALVGHVITWMNVYTNLLDGAAVDDILPLVAAQADAAKDDVVVAYDKAAVQVSAAFRQPGALDRLVHHPMGDIPGSYLLGMRITDNVLHGWDLAVALGLPDAMDPELVQVVHDFLAPIGPGLAGSGYFAAPRQQVTEDMDLQERLLTLTGRAQEHMNLTLPATQPTVSQS